LTMSGTIGQVNAGQSGFGAEVSQVIAGKIKNLAPGQTKRITFAVLAGDNLSDLKAQADAAHNHFIAGNTGPIPSIAGQTICKKDTVDITITPTGATNYGFYSDSEKTELLASGSSHLLSDVTTADTVYITNKDKLFESATVPFVITEDQMVSNFMIFPNDSLDLDTNNQVYGLNQSTPFTSLEWNDGQGNIFTSTNPTFVYSNIGNYNISLTVTSPLGCVDVLTRTLVVTRTTGTDDETNINAVRVYPNPVSGKDQLTIETTVPLELIVTNILGEQLLNAAVSENQKIDIASWPPGYYNVRIKSGERVRNMSLIKQ
jgi:serine protease